MIAQRRSKRVNRFGKLPIKFRDTKDWTAESRARVRGGKQEALLRKLKKESKDESSEQS